MYRLPSIRRARNFHLYGYDGNRYLDLWQNQGRAFWGHNPRGLSQVLKNHISPGLYAPTPHPFFQRVTKLGIKAFPGYTPWFFPNVPSVESQLRDWGFILPADPWDSLEWEIRAGGITASLWRPGLDGVTQGDILCPILPLPGAFLGAMILVSHQSPEGKGLLDRLQTHSTELLSPIQYIAMGHILKTLGEPAPKKEGENPIACLPENFPGFHRRGRYLIPRFHGQEYFTLFKKARQEKVILNPRDGGISLLPERASKGEWSLISRILGDTFHE